MAIALVGTSTPVGANDNDATLTLTIAAGVQENDLTLCQYASIDTGNLQTTSSGWTTSTQTARGNIKGRYFYKVQGATPDSTVDFSISTGGTVGNPHLANGYVFREVDTGTPIDVTATTTNAASGAPDPPSITTVTNDALIIAFGIGIVNDAFVTAPTNFGNNTIKAQAGGGGGALSGAMAVRNSTINPAGTTNPPAWTNWTSGANASMAIALRPDLTVEEYQTPAWVEYQQPFFEPWVPIDFAQDFWNLQIGAAAIPPVVWLASRVDITPGALSAWTDMDISASAPSGATGAVVLVINTSSTTNYKYGLRNNGSTDDRRAGQLRPSAQLNGIVGIDGSRIFEGWVEDAAVKFYLMGYTTSSVTMLTNGINKTPGALDAWTDCDISSDTGADTATAAIVELDVGGTVSGERIWTRMNGSTDARSGNDHNKGFNVVGVDGAEIFEGYVQQVIDGIFLLGYFTAGITMYTNAIDRSLGSTGSFQDLNALPSTAGGGVYEVDVPFGGSHFDIRKNGSSVDNSAQGPQPQKSQMIVECDTSQLVEGWIDSTSVDFYEQGWFLATSASPPVVTDDQLVPAWVGYLLPETLPELVERMS